MQHTTDAGNISVWTDFADDPAVRCPSQSPDWTFHGPMTRNAWVCALCLLPCGYPLSCDVESLACHVVGKECILGRCTALRCPLPRNESEQA